jgi:DNA-directed RNA polymerase sigma subunit (sigma70/sigma32)
MSLIRELGAQVHDTIEDLPVGQIAAAIELLGEARAGLQTIIEDQEGELNISTLKDAASGVATGEQHVETAGDALRTAVEHLKTYLGSIGLRGEESGSGQEPAVPAEPSEEDLHKAAQPGEETEPDSQPAKKDPNAARKRLNRELAERIQEGDEAALAEFLERNARLIERIAGKELERMSTRGMSFEDARQMAMRIAIEAVRKYDTSRSEEVMSYVGQAIHRGVERELGERGHGVRIGIGMRPIIAELQRLDGERLNQGKPPMNDAEIAQHFGISLTDREAGGRHSVESLRRAVQMTSLIHAYDTETNTVDPSGPGLAREWSSDKPAGGAAPRSAENEAISREQTRRRNETAKRLLETSGMTDRQREVIERLMGLGGRPEQTLTEVAADLGVTIDAVRDLRARALGHMRRAARVQGINDPDND